jgi:hypothetical protein
VKITLARAAEAGAPAGASHPHAVA